MFWDSVEITVRAGDGGNGAVSFRTSRGESRGGPDGGDGGDGGSVVLRADPALNTLVDYARQRAFSAPSGKPGEKGRRHGKSAEELELRVPVGTTVYENQGMVADLATADRRVVVAKGGRGGFGNAHFTSSVRQAPRQAELGEPGQERHLRLELKLVADVGVVGIPSAGKSTLLSRVTAAKPKIADYPFTTTVPQLGIATVDGYSLVLADVPGLIEGAHAGKGLGDAFLRHIERTKVIIHLLDATRPDPVADYLHIRHELESFDDSLRTKPEVVALNKADALDRELKRLIQEDATRRLGRPVHLVSAVSGLGLTALLRAVRKLVKDHQPAKPPDEAPVFTLADLAPNAVSVKRRGRGFVVNGAKLERLASQTDFSNPEAAQRFWWVFQRLGAGKQLEKLGARPPAAVTVADRSLAWPGSS